jgi:ribonuclease HII
LIYKNKYLQKTNKPKYRMNGMETKTKKAKVVLKPCYSSETEFEIGIDEAGRGPLFGRVYVSGVVLPKDTNLFHHEWMRDSKQIKSRKKMVELADYIKTNAIAWHIYYADANEIDNTGILNCVIKGMHRCTTEILSKVASTNIRNGLLLVDGNYFRPYSRYDEETESLITVPHETVEKGDGTYSSIAAASILAKNERDTYMEALCKEHPELCEKYSMHTNMGYGTKAHFEGIREHGITEWHRKSYRGVA